MAERALGSEIGVTKALDLGHWRGVTRGFNFIIWRLLRLQLR
jgi:hypothetical protein